jgi:rare lipoprotein A
MKRNTHTKIALCLFGIVCAGITHAEFADIDVTHPYFHAIDSLEESNIVKGYEKGNQRYYKPLNSILRSEVLKVLMLAADIEIIDNGADYFADVPANEWYAPFVNTAADREIVHGFADGDFHPAAQVSRSEFLKMLVLSFDVPVEEEGFEEDWYDRFFRATGNLRILDNLNASPYESISRGEVAELIYRAQKVAESDFTKKYVYWGEGTASYYNEGFAGKTTANGEIYDPMDMTAAHRTLPFGTFLKVSHGDNFVIVRVNDRGPYHKQRIIDLSQKAFEHLAPITRGVISVEFEVVSSPVEETAVVPSALQEYLLTETKNEKLPEVLSEKLSLNIKKKRETIPVFTETVAHLSAEFFPNAVLRRSIPQTIVEGTVFQLSGTAKESGHKEATIFLQPISDKEGISSDQIHFSGAVSGRNFSFPVKFTQAGRYHVGLVFDEEQKSRVEEINVVPLPKERVFTSSNTPFFSSIDVRIVPEKKQVLFDWNSGESVLSKIVFTGDKEQKMLIIEDGLDSLGLETDFFHSFSNKEYMTVELFQSLTNDGTFEQQTTNWKPVTTKTFQVVEGFKDKETEDISVYEFPRFVKTLNSITLEGKLHSPMIKLADHVYVMTPSGMVKQVTLEQRGIDAFRFRFRPEGFGTHVLEIVSDDGEVFFNRAIYVAREYVLPIAPWPEAIVTTESIAGIRHWTNAFRANHEIGSVVANRDLNVFAQQYAEKMALENFISHTSPTGMTFAMRLKREGFIGDFGENLSFGTDLPLALTGLENSGSHRRNLLLAKWTKVGIGFAKNEKGEVYVVQVFGK